MTPKDPQDEQVKIAKSSAVATWVGVAIAASGLLVSIVAVYINRPKKPEPPRPSSAQTTGSATQAPTPQAAPRVQLEGGSTSGIASPPARPSKVAASKRAGYVNAAVRRRNKLERERAR